MSERIGRALCYVVYNAGRNRWLSKDAAHPTRRMWVTKFDSAEKFALFDDADTERLRAQGSENCYTLKIMM